MAEGDTAASVPKVADTPNPWALVNDLSKTSITLGTALLAISVTISDKLLQNQDWWMPWLLGLTWAVLLLVILSAGRAAALSINVARFRTDENNCVWWTNASLLMVRFAGCLILAIGAAPLWFASPKLDASAAMKLAYKRVAESKRVPESSLTVDELVWTPSQDACELKIRLTGIPTPSVVVVDTRTKEVRSIK